MLYGSQSTLERKNYATFYLLLPAIHLFPQYIHPFTSEFLPINPHINAISSEKKIPIAVGAIKIPYSVELKSITLKTSDRIIEKIIPIATKENNTLNIKPKLYPLLLAMTWFDLHFQQTTLFPLFFKLV